MTASDRYLEAITRWSAAKKALDAEGQRTDAGSQRRWETAWAELKESEQALHRMARNPTQKAR